MILIVELSNPASNYQGEPNAVDVEIHLFIQFFIHSNEARNKEIRECLLQNVANSHITHIHLLNERIYTVEELGLFSPKIIQTNIATRLKYKNVFTYIREKSIKGYHIIANSDIFFDNTLENLVKSDIHSSKKMFALLRYEYMGQNIQQSKIFGPRMDSQDTWIFHSNFPINESSEKIFNFKFGQPGCDNKLLYLMKILAYGIYNDPQFIKTYHYHLTQIRDYSNKDRIENPWALSVPYNCPINRIPDVLGINLTSLSIFTSGFQNIQFNDDMKLHNYILDKIRLEQPFIIPRIAGIENNMAVYTRMCNQQHAFPQEVLNYFQNTIPTMKSNAGIKLSTMESIQKYSELYLKAFDNAEMYSGWDLQGVVYPVIAQTHDYIKNTYINRQIIWARALDIFNYIHDTPWTFALRGKRILIISAFKSSILEKIPIRAKIYQKDGQDVDLFPECEITVIKPMQTQSGESSREFDIELTEFCGKLDAIKDTYDIALVSSGGYGNLICNHIFESGKSAIYVGGVLQMYFGILGNRWLTEYPDAVRLFLNEHWSRPKPEEKPKDYEKVEKGCYW